MSSCPWLAAPSRPTPLPQIEQLPEYLTRRIFLIALIIGAFGGLATWVLEESAGKAFLFQRLAYPSVILFCAVLAVQVFRSGVSRRLELTAFAGFVLYFLIRFAYLLFLTLTDFERRTQLTDFSDWIPIIYVLAFVLFDSKRALVASLVFFVLSLLIGVSSIGTDYLLHSDTRLVFQYSQYFSSNAIIVTLFFAFARLKEESARARAISSALEQLAVTDPLTGVYNRRPLDAALKSEMDMAASGEHPLCLIVFDLDNYKEVNDTYGHDVGDSILLSITALVKQYVRKTDQLYRWGGDEFLVLLPDTRLIEGSRLAERLRGALEQQAYARVGSVTACFAVVEYLKGDTVKELLKRGDELLYTAKAGGRNRVECQRSYDGAKPEGTQIRSAVAAAGME